MLFMLGWGGALERPEDRVDFESLREIRCALRPEFIALKTVKQESKRAVRANSRKDCGCSVLERGEGLVESEPLRESLGALGTEVVHRETAKE